MPIASLDLNLYSESENDFEKYECFLQSQTTVPCEVPQFRSDSQKIYET